VARYLVLTSISQAGSIAYPKGAVVDLTSARVTALGASNFRAVNNPSLAAAAVTTYTGGATLTAGTSAGSPTHDTNGEAAGASN
jgi:hypothetical protein